MPADLESQSILFGGNEAFVAELYSRYLEKPDSVDPSWREIFDDLGGRTSVIGQISEEERAAEEKKKKANGHALPPDQAREAAQKSVRALMTR